ncbi:hypothetical protein R83H12_00763 [Fibrobacteria bacterium R8-3-H12]
MRNNLFKIAHNFTILSILIIGGIGVQTIISCSGDSGGGGNGNDNGTIDASEGKTYTYGIKNLSGTSFTMVDKYYSCRENGTLEEVVDEYPTSYSINGTTLSFADAEFSGSSNSIIGIWNSPSLVTVRFNGDNYTKVEDVSKVVFTQTTITFTSCGKDDYDLVIDDPAPVKVNGYATDDRECKFIDCVTQECTKGTEKVIIKSSGTALSFTYNGKTCSRSNRSEFSKTQLEKACKEAYDKVKAENPGYDGNEKELDNAFDDILYKDFYKCMENFPEWTP